MAKQKKPRTPDESPVSFNARDGQRIANAVIAHENSRRMPNPSVLPRASRGGGGGEVRLCQFVGDWTNEPGQSGTDNVRLVRLYKKNPASPGPNGWMQETGASAFVKAINLMSYIPTPRGGPVSLWGAITPIGTMTESDGTSVPLWLLISAQC